MAAKFELYKDKADEFRWRLVHQNGNIIADSGEGYTNKAGAMNGIESVKENCVAAPVKELPAKAPAAKAPAAKAPAAKAPVAKAKFQLYKDKAGEFRWRLIHQNGNIIADSGEGYTNKAGAMNGIESVKENCGAAPVKEMPAKAKKAAPAPSPMPKTVRYSAGMGIESGGDVTATIVACAAAAWFIASAGILIAINVS